MAINTHQADHVEYIQDSNGNKHYLNAEYLDGHSYADISNAIGGKADQSAIHDGTLTIQKNGATIATFTANQNKSATANIIVPTSIDGLSGGTVNGNITLTKELVFANNQNPFIKMSTAGNTYFFQSAGGQFSLGPTWDLATKWSVDGSVQFPKKVDFAVRPVVGSKEVALKSEIPAAVSESTVSGWGFTKNKGTVTSVATADGITGGSITSSGTIKANLKSYTKNTAEIGGRLYGVELDKNGKLAVNVPWTDTHADISNLVPYLGAISDVNLGNHSLLISDTTSATGVMVKVSGKQRTENDTSVTIKPGQIGLTGIRGATATLASSVISITDDSDTYRSDFTINGFRVLRREDTDGDGQFDVTYSSTYGLGEIKHNNKKLLLPEKEGTIALTDDLSTLLDKGTSSTVVNQVVYNPVEMKKALKVPSIRGENSGNNHMNGAPLYSLGSTMATENGQATGSSSLSLTGYTGATGNPRSTIIAQRASGDFVISPEGWRGSKDLCFSDSSDKWTIAGSPILTESSISTQQWTLTDVNGNGITVNICVK